MEKASTTEDEADLVPVPTLRQSNMKSLNYKEYNLKLSSGALKFIHQMLWSNKKHRLFSMFSFSDKEV